MKKVMPKKTDEFTVKYHVLTFECPYCGAENEIHLEEDALFIDKTDSCYKCKREFHILYMGDKIDQSFPF